MRKTRLATLALLLSHFAVWGPSPAVGASFQGLGLPPAGGDSYVKGVSSDGSTVVGYIETDESSEAFRWTAAGGLQMLGSLAGDSDSRALAVSADGAFIYGDSGGPSDLFDLAGRAFRWSEAEGMQVLADLSGILDEAQIVDVSSDGTAVLGEGVTPFDFGAFHWSAANGLQWLGDLPGSFGSIPAAVSDDGAVVVGSSFVESGGAYRWTSDGGMQNLGAPPEAGMSFATGVSGDGATAVGSTPFFEAFRWTVAGGLQALGEGYPEGVSSDGSVVVGGTFEFGAFIWDAAHGIRELQQVLVDDYGLDLAGWSLDAAVAVSADHLTIVGEGVNPNGQYESWIARLEPAPEPSSAVLLGVAGVVLFGPRGRRSLRRGGDGRSASGC